MATSDSDRPIIFLSGEQIYLRPIEVADAARYQRWINDPQTRRFLLNVRPLNEIAERRFIEGTVDRPDDVAVAIVARDGDRHIGGTGLHQCNWVSRHATLGIVIGEPECRGKGYGTAATGLMLRHAFETLNFNRVQLDVYAFNAAGIRCYEKAGFVREGVQREGHYADGRFHDIFRYGILAREYFERTRNGVGA